MKITIQATDEAVLSELGQRLAQARLAQNLTQAELALQSGVSKRTVERLESGSAGGGTRLAALIRVCRTLNLLDRLETAFPESTRSPIAQMKSDGRKRRRASSSKKSPPSHSTWTWGDEK